MKNAKKPEHILKLEEGCQTALSEILNVEAIVKRSKKALGMSEATTLKEAMHPLQLIARKYNLKLHFKREYDRALEILKKERA